MKLRTKCSPHTQTGSTDDFLHDASVAHALLQAMGECPEHLSGSNAMRWAQLRANELLAEWGYSDTGYSTDIGITDKGEVGT